MAAVPFAVEYVTVEELDALVAGCRDVAGGRSHVAEGSVGEARD